MAFLELLMRLRNPFLDYLSLGISYLGTPFLVVGVITFLRFNDDQNRADGMMLAFLFSGLLCQGLKIVFHVPRPWILISDTALFGLFRWRCRRQPDTPSPASIRRAPQLSAFP